MKTTSVTNSVAKVARENKAAAVNSYHRATKWAGKEIGTAVRNNPVRTLGIVAAAGLIAGLLLGRR